MKPNDERNATILVIDDEKAIRRMLRLSLEAHGYNVTEAATYKAGLSASVEPLPDLILLDLGLPDGSGLDLLQHVREFSPIRIIVISARGSEQDKIELLDAGADDYLTKPFSMGELLARVRVALRHRQAQEDTPAEFVNGGVRIDALRRVVSVDGESVHLTPTEYALLLVLSKNAGRYLTHAQITAQIWGGDLNETAGLRVYIAQLRKKLGPVAGSDIENLPGVGYRLKARPASST